MSYKRDRKDLVRMFDIKRLMEVLSEILSDKYGVKITVKATPKNKEEVA